MKLARPDHPTAERPLADERGAAYVEFLISFIPLFFLFTGMVQMALVYAADLVVQHSASRAARAAAVVLDDDPERYDGQERRSVEQSGGGAEVSVIATLLGVGSVSGMGGDINGGPRMSAIRTAAAAPLVAISPSLEQLQGGANESIGVAIGSPMGRAAVGSFRYNQSAMAVSFPTSPGATSYRDRFPAGPNVQVTTRVTYLFHCGVPLANRLMCETFLTMRNGPLAGLAEGIVADLASGNISHESAMARLERIDVSRDRHERDSPAMDELEQGSNSGELSLTAATGARFKVLRGEATMPLQYSRYRYPSE